MAHTLKTKQERALYGKRKCTVEPVFGIIKQIMGFRPFSFRGLQRPRVNGSRSPAYNLKRLPVLARICQKPTEIPVMGGERRQSPLVSSQKPAQQSV